MNHIIRIKIYYEDTDCGGVIYYANYLRYLERARTEFMEFCGLSLKKIKEDGFQFVVRHVDIEYLLPGHYSDVISVETSVEKADGLRIIFKNTIINESTKKTMGKKPDGRPSGDHRGRSRNRRSRSRKKTS